MKTLFFSLCTVAAYASMLVAPAQAQGYWGNNYYGYSFGSPGNGCCPQPCCPPQCCPPPCCPCPCPEPCCPQPCCPQPCCPQSNLGCLWVKGSGLFMRACSDNLAFGIQKRAKTHNHTSFKDEFVHPDQHWRWGYRGEIGTRILCDCWDVSLAYTHILDDASEEEHNHRKERLFPIYGNHKDHRAHIRADWDLMIDYADVTISRTFCICDCVNLKPHIGGRGARVHADYKIRNHFVHSERHLVEKIDLDNHFRGAGIKAGLDGVWKIGCGLSLVSNSAGSILWGRRHDEFTNRTFATVNNKRKQVRKDVFSDRDCKNIYMIDLGVGLRWETSCLCCVTLGIEAMYESHMFINFSHFANKKDILDTPTLAEGSRGDLTVNGGRFSAYLSF